MKNNLFLTVFLLFGLLFSCRNTKDYPDEPIIEFKDVVKFTSADGIDTLVRLTISFTDGDGDLGYRSGDTSAPFNPGSEFYYNFFMKIFYMDNGNFTEFVFPSGFPPHYRIPAIASEDNTKATAGDLIVDIEVKNLAWELISPKDTFKLEIYVSDRALHKSNVVSTSSFYLNLTD